MNTENDWQSFIFDSSLSFSDRFQKVFEFQASKNKIYKKFIDVFGLSASTKIEPSELPLLPIRGFKMAKIITDNTEPVLIFRSSGTSSMERSTHYIADPNLYKKAISEEFNKHFSPDEYAVLCHMPGYSENTHSSLTWMANYLVNSDNSGMSSFFDDVDSLKKWNEDVTASGKKPLIFGAAFALLDLIETGNFEPVQNLEIIETGGMKTYRREITKAELRKKLSDGFEIDERSIHSEYGMCELLSQMYAMGTEWFKAPHWVEISIRNADNPSELCKPGVDGKIGIIDLANVNSCPFILTDDRGVMNTDGRFKIHGRWNNDDLRGCNFLIDRD